MEQISTGKVGESGKCGRKWKRIRNFATVKNLIRHSILLLLAFCITLGSVGIALGQQLCQMVMIGDSEKPAKEMSGCCSEGDTTDTEDDCCTLKITYKKLDLVSAVKADVVKKLYFAVPQFTPPILQFLTTPVAVDEILHYSDSSPPLYGRQLLLFKRVLLV